MKNNEIEVKSSVYKKLRSYLNLQSLLLFGAGAAAGFVVGGTGRLVGDIFAISYKSLMDILYNPSIPGFYDLTKYTMSSFSQILPRAVEEGSRAAPIYGAGTLVLGRYIGKKLSKLNKR